jgi:hypothetical protein
MNARIRIRKAIQTCEVAVQRAETRLTKRHPYYETIETQLSSLRQRIEQKKQDGPPKDEQHGYGLNQMRNRPLRQFKARSHRTW